MKTTKMKKVLIALDYDPTAQKVAEAGYSLAKTMGAEITLLHVVLDPIIYSPTGHITIMGFGGLLDAEPMGIESAKKLKNASQLYLDKSKEHLGDDSIQTLIKEGDFAESILEAAKQIRADVIVMGSHSQKWLENVIMGSVTEKVLRQTTKPLFIIPTKKI